MRLIIKCTVSLKYLSHLQILPKRLHSANTFFLMHKISIRHQGANTLCELEMQGRLILEHVYMKPEVKSNRFEISNHFENFLFNHYDNPV